MEKANRMSSFLYEKALEKGTVIGLQSDDKADLIAAIIGVVNAGCVFVIIDRGMPGSRLSLLMKDIDLRHLAGSADLSLPDEAAGGLPVALYNMEHILSSVNSRQHGPIPLPHPGCREDDAIYIYFTSGSTGVPKGIIGRNESLLQFLQWEIAHFGLTGGVRVSQLISPTFDAFLRDIFAPLLAGGTVCIPPDEEDFFTDKKLITWLDSRGIELIHCVPSLFRVINGSLLTADKLVRLKYILLSGEKINPSELANWYAVFGDRIRLFNLYGATETTMIRSYYEIRPEDTGLEKIPIGQPIPGTELLILRDDLKPAAPMVPGELYIISPYTSKGYLNAPELTHERFIKWEQGPLRGAIAFRTGDMARKLADGKIVLLGRKDRQVKIRGIRIELDEIEQVLVRCDSVENAVALKIEDASGNDQLVAFIIPSAGNKQTPGNPEIVYEYLRRHLPAYMIPSNILEVQAYPLLSNGKIDYKKLPGLLTVSDIIAPANNMEEKVLAIWQGILGDKQISTEISFHKAGGNSLTLMSLSARIYEQLNVRISLSQLFSHLTIKAQADLIRLAKKDDLLTIPSAPPGQPYRLSSAQKRMYYNFELNKTGTAFNLPAAYEIKGIVDRERIELALKKLIKRQESLRTRFLMSGGRLVQEVKEDVDFELESFFLADEHVSDSIRAFIRPFDLGSAPLFRAGIISCKEGIFILVMDIHHIICDGQSQINLYSDFLSLYNGEDLAPLEIQYKDYAEWENDFRETSEYISYREFWLSQFEGKMPQLILPVTAPVKGETLHDGGNLSFQVQRPVLKALMETMHEKDVTTFSALFSIFLVYLVRITGQENIVVSIAASGRIQRVLEPVIGMFVKTLPIRCDVDPYKKFSDLVLEMHRHLVEANSRQLYDLTDMVRELNARQAGYGKGLADVMFVFQNFDNTPLQQLGADFSMYPFENHTSKNALTLYATEEAEAFHFRFEYSTAYFSKPDIQILTDLFKSLIERIAADPQQEIIDCISSSPLQPATMDSIEFNF